MAGGGEKQDRDPLPLSRRGGGFSFPSGRYPTADALRFEWLLPGHGDRRHLPAAEAWRRMQALATRTATLRPRPVDFTATRW
ncbi:hypothetical protein BBN63_21965 [Streptomyces niveus]|uniref:Uncharacterized protein n=1 Tax=Streptomyces niveus TaxID=193462 RepID=A0A1U9QXD0_STRNV|nr:hypothetical protein BBN63_21965 [Streptomyces niveus]